MSSRPTRLKDRVGRAPRQAPRRAVANAIEAACLGQKAIENEELVLEGVIRTCDVFLFEVEVVVLIDCGARKAVSIDRVGCSALRWVRCVVSGSEERRAGWFMVAVVLCGARCVQCGRVMVEQVKGNRSVQPSFTMHRSKQRK